MWFARCVTVSSPRMLFHMGMMIIQPQRRRLYHVIFRPPGCSVLKHMLHVERAEFCDVSKLCNTSGPLDYTILRLGCGPGVVCAFWLGSVLRATTACTFSTSQLPKVVWEWCVLYILTWKCASRHNDVQFFISHLAIWLRTHRFSDVTFRPSGAPNHWRNTVNRDFPTFSRTCIFFPLWSSHFLTSPPWLFPPLLFHLSILSEVWLLNFLRSEVSLFFIRNTAIDFNGESPRLYNILWTCGTPMR